MSNGNYREINKFSPTLPAQFSPQTTASATAAATMEWTNEDALELIEQYRSHTELWNRADLKYKDKLCRFRAWSDIADRFGCTKAEVERKMNVLLTQYRREKHKMLMKLYSGIQPGPSKWYAFKRFDFLEGGNNAILAAARHHNRHLHRHLQQQQRRQQASNGLVNASTALNVIDIVAGGAGGGGRGNNSSSNNSRGSSSSSFIQSHRKLRNRDMKYFGALGLSLPMLISSSQRLSTWNNAEPFSSPPLPAPTSENDNGRHAATPKIGFSPGTAAQQHHLPPNSMSNTVEELLSGITRNAKSENKSLPANECDDKEEMIEEDNADDSVSIVTESVPSPSPSVADSEAAPSSSLAAAVKTTTALAAATTTTTSGAITTPSATYSDQISHDELDIKQELGDFFPAPTLAPAPPDSNRSYSSSDEQNRLGGVGDSFDDFAQDLRVSAAAVAAAAKSINFRHFVSPHHQSNNNSNNNNTNTNSINLTQPFDILRTHPMLQQQHHHQHHHLSTSSSTRQLLMDSLLNESFRSDCSDRADIDEQIAQHSNKNNNKNNILNDIKSFSTAAAATSVAPPSVHVPQQAITAAVVTENEQKDDCDYVGSNVTLKLRSMDRTQRIIAEKLISEILFYGQFSELEKTAKIIPK